MTENPKISAEPTQTFLLPDVGEGLTEAEIVSWHVAVGDEVSVNQIVVDIETAKSIVELPSPYRGVVRRLLAEPGTTVPVGAAIIEIAVEGGDRGVEPGDAPQGGTVEPAEPETGDAAPKLLVGYGASDLDRVSRRRRTAPGAASHAPAPQPSPSAHEPSPGQGVEPNPPVAKPRAKPPVRKLAKELGVDLALVTPSGSQQTVTRDDVRRAAAPSPADEQARAGTTAEPTRIPIKGVRKATAAAMVASAFTAPHVTEFVTVDVTRTLELRADLRQRPEFAEVKLTPLALVARAYLIALSRTPMATARWDEQAQEIIVPNSINLGIAAATPRGLIVPNIKQAETLGLARLADAIAALAGVARAGKTPPGDLADGTTTITNIGVFGIDSGTPILNPGETAILAVGAVNRRPWVVETKQGERIRPRSIMQLALSFDHRVLDGAEGSRLLADTAELLAEPGLAML